MAVSCPFPTSHLDELYHLLLAWRTSWLTLCAFVAYSPISRSHQTVLANPPGGAATRDEGAFQSKADVDGSDIIDLLGDEPDAIVWYRVIRYLGSSILVANDVGK